MRTNRHVEAIAALTEVLDAVRELSAVQPGRYLLALATDLGNLGNALHEVGRASEALPVLKEALACYRRLRRIQNPRVVSEFAEVLINVGIVQAELGQLNEAIASTGEAVRLYRRIAAGLPHTRQYFAASLMLLGRMLLEAGQLRAADEAFKESIGWCKELLHEQQTTAAEAHLKSISLDARRLRKQILRRRHSRTESSEEVASLPPKSIGTGRGS